MSNCTCAACEKRNREYLLPPHNRLSWPSLTPLRGNRNVTGTETEAAQIRRRIQLLSDTKRMILARRDQAYGSLQITEEQAEELARNLVQMWQLRERK
jgi:hypothetical protein